MIIQIEFPSEIEKAIQRRAAEAGQEVAEFLREAVVQQLQLEQPSDQKVLDAEGFSERLRKWVALHPVLDHVIDDSRESFYEGRE
jgi:hypothetical protein